MLFKNTLQAARQHSLVACVALFSAALVAPSAHAVTFNFQGNGVNNQSTANFSEGGIDLTVNALRNFDPIGGSTDGNINRHANGIGVSGGANFGRLEANEALQFLFTPAVTLLDGLVFESGNLDEQFSLFDSANTFVSTFTVFGSSGTPGGTQLFDFSGLNIIGSFFTIVGVDAPGQERNEGVRIAEINVSAAAVSAAPQSTAVSAVPLPAALPLMMLALGGLVLVGRRRQATLA